MTRPIKPYCKHFLVSLCLLAVSCVAQAQQDQQHAELTALLRQIEQMQAVIAHAGSQPNDVRSRYYFDYQRLNADLARVRAGIEHYLTPKRAQPRDMFDLLGEYQQETSLSRRSR